MWIPISSAELEALISVGETKLEGNLINFWNLIKIKPCKWQEREYGNDGGGFWVVAVFGDKVVYYNDIEQGFNISPYHTHGYISEYWCEQRDLDEIVLLLFHNIITD